MTRIEPFRQLARFLKNKGVKNVIICPGSRNAILTIAFTAEEGLNCYSISDERSAAYMGIGMALECGMPSVIICTSGTAALNFAPAIAEAFFQEIPLLVLTADRPPEWIHQYDGQTIFQDNVYGNHVKASFSFSADQTPENLEQSFFISEEAFETTLIAPKGPVHINIPIREPFYPENIPTDFEEWPLRKKENKVQELDTNAFIENIRHYSRRVLVIGQQHSKELRFLASQFAQKYQFVLIADAISNIEGGIKNQDKICRVLSHDFQPDFLISTDMSLISKPLKLFLRNAEIKDHWHVQDNPYWIDPFRSLKKKIKIDPVLFFKSLLAVDHLEPLNDFVKTWFELEEKSRINNLRYFEQEKYSELHFLQTLLCALQSNTLIHAGNSMSVRYINALQQFLPESTSISCNRGTSGIDGSLSTAVGQALQTDKQVLCILGDVSFHYDKNALWNSHVPDNLKVVVLNNQGGLIFRMIEGPSKQSSFETFFQTKQQISAEWIAKQHSIQYFEIKESEGMKSVIHQFLEYPGKAILEIFTDPMDDEKAFKEFINY